MDARLLDLYEAELRYFRDTSQEFASAYPKIAGRLGIDGQTIADPYVERLIEATAFLSARVSLKLDAEFPRFTGHLLDIVYPGYFAPTPSMLVASCIPDLDDDSLALGRLVPRGSILRTRQAVGQGTQCEFRTCRDMRLWPLEVTRASYFSFAPDLNLNEHPRAREIRGGLRIQLQATAGLMFNQINLDELVIHFGGAPDVAWQLHECCLGKPLGVLVKPAGALAASQGGVQTLPLDTVRPVGYGDDEALLPVTSTGFAGYRLAQEYFAFPERFQFMELHGLRKALQQMPHTEIEIVILFSRGDAALEKLVSAENVLLNCCPAINLFEKRLDRVNVTEAVSEFHLVPDRTRPMDFEVHTLLEVVGHGKSQEQGPAPEQIFRPFYSAFHDSRHAHPAYYTVSREPRLLSQKQRTQGHRSSHIGSEVFIQLVDPQEAPYSGNLRQLAVMALCTNRDLPMLMQVGRSNELEFAGSFPVKRVAIVRSPSRPVSPVMQAGLGWKVIDHLAQNYLSLSDGQPQKTATALREMLALYAMHADESSQSQLRGLRGVHTKPITRRLPLPGPIAFGRGLEVTLEVEKDAFHGHSAFAFGAMMSHFLARHVNVNHFIETVLSFSGKGESMRWEARCGQRQIL
jgi:type VI secretion system protein ImpG